VFLQYGSDEGRVIRSPVEVLNHCCFSDLGDAISHGLKPLEVRPKHFIPPRRLMDLRSHSYAGLSERDWKLAIKRRLKSLQSSLQCHGRCHSHCNASCPRTMGKYAVITSSVAPAARAVVV
jgi:hypothetical protein